MALITFKSISGSDNLVCGVLSIPQLDNILSHAPILGKWLMSEVKGLEVGVKPIDDLMVEITSKKVIDFSLLVG